MKKTTGMINRRLLFITIPQKIRTRLEKYYNKLIQPFYIAYCDKTIRAAASGINDRQRQEHIVVSLTSYPARFATLHLVLKSLLTQSVKPDKLILYIDDYVADADIPRQVWELQDKGLSIKKIPHDLKPHKKYFFAMREYPRSLIITADDDILYHHNTIKTLLSSYRRYPQAVSAMRVHKMVKQENGFIAPYNQWYYEYAKERKPSLSLCATGIGGVLYPPGCMDSELFNIQNIKKLCHNADDIWLKFMQLKANTPVVWAKPLHILPIELDNYLNTGLNTVNVHQSLNDQYIKQVGTYYNIDLADYC